MNERRQKVRKSGSQNEKRKPEAGDQQTKEENNSAPDSCLDEDPTSEIKNNFAPPSGGPNSEIKNKRRSPLEHLKKTNKSEKSEIEIPTSEVKHMEVHHHPEVEKKGLKEYLLEGLMIFLAVTMGFFAESLREHMGDKDRANEQAHSFYLELKSDSATAALAVKNWNRKNQAIFYMKRYFEGDSSLINCPKLFPVNFYYAFRINTPSRFEPKTVILEQLKNSGSLRYFKSKELQRLTGELSVAISNVRQRNEVDNYYLENYINQFVIKYNDPFWYDKMNPNDEQVIVALANYEKSSLVIPFHLNNPAGFNRNESLNMIGDFQLVFKATRTIMYKRYQDLNHTLLAALRKEYDLE